MTEDFAHQNLVALKNKSFDIKFDLDNSKYKAIEKIGTGAYGVVCSAEHMLTKTKVAIKKITDIFEQPTIAKRTYREIKILKHFKHDNVIAIRDILKPPGDIGNLRDVYIVLDLMETDMHRIIHSEQEITDEHVRYFLYQILRGLKYIHSANVIHRDLKPSNLLVNENCDVKIGDFGMARGISSDPDGHNLKMTQYVATRWYRAPELVMARVAYTGAVDMWSVGCIFAEMLGRKQIFPGKDYIHQLKLIIGIMGSPPPEFLQLTQSPAIRNFITSWGMKKPVPLQELYPKASSLAIDLLTRMLAMDPQSRISVEWALSHPFLKKYHDPQDEPCCVPAFDFSFEKKDLPPEELKSAIIKEILDYHPVSEKPKIAFVFRPVPKSEIQQKSSPKKKSPGTKADPFVSTDKEVNFGLNAFLKTIRKPETTKESVGQENKPLVPQPHQKPSGREFTGSGKPLSFLSTNSPTSEFKVPVGLPLGKQDIKVKREAEDVEMLSAKSEIRVQTDVKPEADEEMPSANKLVGETKVKKEQEEPDKTLNTKEVLKAAILNAALRKHKRDSGPKSIKQPVTAMQRQKEREEKKQKKLEKAMERKKKQKDKEKNGRGITLSDEDKNLLQRWSTMQRKPVATTITNSETVCDITGESTEQVSFTETTATHSVSDSLSSHQPSVMGKETLPRVQESNTKASSSLDGIVKISQDTGQKSGVSQTKVFINLPPRSNPLQTQVTSVNSAIPNGSVHSFTFQESRNHSTDAGPSNTTHRLVHSKSPEEAQVVNNSRCEPRLEDSMTPQVSLVNTQQHLQQPPFTTSSQNYEYSLQSLSPLDTDMKSSSRSLDDILNQLFNDDDSTSKLPPTYSEALESKLHTLSPPSSVQSYGDTVKSATKQIYLPFNSYQPGEPSLESVYSPPDIHLNHTNSNPSSSADNNTNNTGEGVNMLSVITRQMMRSHVEDLTLTKTPKGTGGTGYGVGTDLESLMEEAAKDGPLDRSAPISATESLIGDWLEVSGMKGVDSKEYEALERELGLGSPINIHDIVTSAS